MKLLIALIALVLVGNLHADQQIEDLAKQANEAYRTGRFEACRDLCQQALKIDPNHAAINNLMGAALVQEREFAKARKYFVISAKANENANSAFNLCEIDFVTHDWKKSKLGFEKILARQDANQPLKALARFKLVVIALQLDDQESLKQHLHAFKTAKMQQELDFYFVLRRIHDKKLSEKEARLLWTPLKADHRGAANYIDTLIETYFQKEK